LLTAHCNRDGFGAMTLSEQVYQDLRRDIVSGVLEPRLPLRLDRLKTRYGVGFSPLREALSRLQSERLVDAVALRGFTVAPMSIDKMWDAINTRLLIETDALRRAIDKGDDRWEATLVAAMHALSLQYRRLPDGPLKEPQTEALRQRHQEFHAALISACGSDWLLDFAEKLTLATERYRHTTMHRLIPEQRRDLDAEHRALMEAAVARDADRACGLLTEHYTLTGRHMAAQFGTGQAG